MKRLNKRFGPVTGRRLAALSLAVIFCLALAAGEGRTSTGQENSPGQPETRTGASFIKKELLDRLKPEMAAVKRDPFRPVSTGAVRGPVRMAVPAEASDRPVRQASILESLNLSCSGLVTSGNKKMALILVDGQAITLAEGEELIPGIRLTRIAADEVIFQDDQGNSRKVRVKEK
ncbi:MAG: hypothetical protein QHH43_02800 [Candidatus Saccharicenans sp.]|jgi:hypothetical protein|nr:hypothetical protein [Candidatus Saccharicenans sp.]MDH7574673.1 hypothetical protein [Candidatus Saccharicenans sp.]